MTAKIKFVGNPSAMLITSDEGINILIDPGYLKASEVKDKIDFICISHIAEDHLGEGIEIAKTTQGLYLFAERMYGHVQ